MKYRLPNGKTIELNDNCKNIAERYGGKLVKEQTKETKQPKKK